jgi:hypothetical protein
VLLFLSYPLCALAMYALVRRWFSGPAAAIAGFFYAFAVFRYELPPQHQTAGTYWMPLTILCTERWFERGRPRDAIGLGLTLLLQALCSVYLGFALLLAYGTYLVLAGWRWRRVLRARIRGLGLAGGAAAALVGLVMAPYAYLQHAGLISSYGAGDEASIGLVPYFAALATNDYLARGGVGPVGWTLAALALVPGWRARFPRALGAALAAVGILTAYGPGIWVRGHVLWSPYTVLMWCLPGFSAIRCPVRFVVVAQLGLALLAAAGFARLTASVRAAPAWVGALVVAAGALWSFGPLVPLPLRRVATVDDVPAVYRWLSTHGEGKALLEEPATTNITIAAQRMFFSTFHWLPVVDGYSGYYPRTAEFLHGVAAGLPQESAVQELVDHVDVGWILVHRAELHPAVAQRWAQALPPGLEQVGDWGPDLLLRVTRAARRDRGEWMRTARETADGAPLVPLERCPGWLRIRVPPPDPWVPRQAAFTVVEVTNTGTAPWPGLAVFPRHLVRLQVDTWRADHTGQQRQDQWLSRDVAPGSTVLIATKLVAPMAPGPYTLRFSLEQVGDGPLARCGVDPVEVAVTVGTPTAR